MNSSSSTSELLGIGLYTIAGTAELLRISPRTIRRWMSGYDYRQGDVIRHVDPLWVPALPQPDGETELSFRDLIELRFVQAFTKIGLDLRTIRGCLDLARDCVQSDRPFSSGRFRTDGQTIFLEGLKTSDDPILLDLKRRQYVLKGVLDQTFRDLDVEDDAVARWRPFHGKRSIVIDPDRSFGQPIAAEFGVPTLVLADAVEAEGSVARVAALYEVNVGVVKDAVKFQRELTAA